MASAHPEDVKAQVLAALLAGQGVREVARAFKLSPGTASAWRNAAGIPGPSGRSNAIGTEQRAELGEKVGRVLDSLLTTVQVQAEFARDQDWLRKQSAGELAVFVGVICDKAFRILEAVQPDEPEPPGGDDPDDGAPPPRAAGALDAAA